MTRTAEDVFRDHGRAVNAGDLQAIVADYADDAVILTAQGPLSGRAGVEAFFTQAFSLLPDVHVAAKQMVSAEDSLLVWWTAESPAGRIDDGIDTFVIKDGLITLQTITFTINHHPPQ